MVDIFTKAELMRIMEITLIDCARMHTAVNTYLFIIFYNNISEYFIYVLYMEFAVNTGYSDKYCSTKLL